MLRALGLLVVELCRRESEEIYVTTMDSNWIEHITTTSNGLCTNTSRIYRLIPGFQRRLVTDAFKQAA